MWSYCTCRKISLNFVRKLGIWHSTGIYSQTAFKSNSYLFWIAVYFVFQKKVWKSCGFPGLYPRTPSLDSSLTFMQPLRPAILATVETKTVFLDFLELKSLQGKKKLHHISYLPTVYGWTKSEKSRFFEFCRLMFANQKKSLLPVA